MNCLARPHPKRPRDLILGLSFKSFLALPDTMPMDTKPPSEWALGGTFRLPQTIALNILANISLPGHREVLRSIVRYLVAGRAHAQIHGNEPSLGKSLSLGHKQGWVITLRVAVNKIFRCLMKDGRSHYYLNNENKNHYWMPKLSPLLPGAAVISGCEPPYMGVGN